MTSYHLAALTSSQPDWAASSGQSGQAVKRAETGRQADGARRNNSYFWLPPAAHTSKHYFVLHPSEN